MPSADREEALFVAALEKPTAAEARGLLDGACGGDRLLRERIEALLAAHDTSAGVLDAAALWRSWPAPTLSQYGRARHAFWTL